VASSKFRAGDVIRRLDGANFSCGPTAVVCRPLPRQHGIDSPSKVWIVTPNGPKYILRHRVEFVSDEAVIENWLEENADD